MVKIYFELLRKGLRTLESIPALWRESVLHMLENEEGYHDPNL